VKVDDKHFTTSLVDGLTERLCLDKDRIYVTGMGTGGGLTHLLACDPFFSDNIAAFALVNPTILVGLMRQGDIKDEITLLWEKCRPSRVPVRLLEIHGENNTLNSYWGKSTARRGRLPTVQWIVEWAVRNECGEAKGMPTKDKESDLMFKTELATGTIYEGMVYPKKLQRAMYRCYALTPEEEIERYIENFHVVEPNAEKIETKKSDGEIVERGPIILEHLFVKNYGHGWPRIAMKNGTTETFDTTEIEETKDSPTFDATKEVLKWFNQHKLSDESRVPNTKVDVEAHLAKEGVNKMVERITAQVEKQQQLNKDRDDAVEEPGEKQNKDKKKEEEEESTKERVKDEL
jgi:poly(3-hydroxybutyrate) depolymerase